MLDYDKLFEALLDEAKKNREAVPIYGGENILIARMAANHVLISLAVAISKARQ